MRRRALLAIAASGVLGGCIERGGSRDEQVGGDASDAGNWTTTETPFRRFETVGQDDAFSNVQNATGLDDGETGKSARVALAEGGYTHVPFAVEEPSEMHLTGHVMTNGPIDCYVMTVDQFNQYQREPDEIDAEAEFERVDAIDLARKLQSDDYLFVFDNTYLGEAEPSGEVEFEVVLGASAG